MRTCGALGVPAGPRVGVAHHPPTIPLTGAVVARILGRKFTAVPFGVVFPGREIGCLPGVGPGGLLRDRTAPYGKTWRDGISFRVSAAVVGRSVDGKPFPRPAAKKAA